MKVNSPHFFEEVQKAKKVLVVDLGFLGDSIHLIPALGCIRKSLPQARLDVMVSEHVRSIMDLVPWVDRVIGYPRFPKRPPFYKDIPRLWRLRQEKYDLVINLAGSQRSCYITWATAAPYRMGRIERKPFWFRKIAFTHAAEFPFDRHIAKQRFQILQDAGFPYDTFEYAIEFPEGVQAKIDAYVGDARFIHVSPCTNENYKELPLPVLAAFLNSIHECYPQLKIVLSSAPTDRELAKMNKELLPKLTFKPWKLFLGTLSVIELTALIKKSLLHLGGDSGAFHAALLGGVPSLIWFRRYEGMVEWVPEQGDGFCPLIGEATPRGIEGIQVDALLSSFEALYQKVDLGRTTLKEARQV